MLTELAAHYNERKMDDIRMYTYWYPLWIIISVYLIDSFSAAKQIHGKFRVVKDNIRKMDMNVETSRALELEWKEHVEAVQKKAS